MRLNLHYHSTGARLNCSRHLPITPSCPCARGANRVADTVALAFSAFYGLTGFELRGQGLGVGFWDCRKLAATSRLIDEQHGPACFFWERQHSKPSSRSKVRGVDFRVCFRVEGVGCRFARSDVFGLRPGTSRQHQVAMIHLKCFTQHRMYNTKQGWSVQVHKADCNHVHPWP